jgi:hypothetical protein
MFQYRAVTSFHDDPPINNDPDKPKLPQPATTIQKQHEASASSGQLPIDQIRPEEEHKAEKDTSKRQKKQEKKEKKEKDEVNVICRGSHEVPDVDVPQAPSPKKLPLPATTIEKQAEASASSGQLPIDRIRPEEENKAEKDAAKRQKKQEKKEKKEKDEVKREKAKKKKKTTKIKSEEQSDQTLPEEQTHSPSPSEGSVHTVKHDAKEDESYYSTSPSQQNSPRRSRSPPNRKSHIQERPKRQENVRHSSTKDKKEKSQKTQTVYRDRTVSEGFKTGPSTTCFRGHTASVCRMYTIPNYLLTCSKCDFDIKVNDVVSLCHSCDPTFIACLSCTVRRIEVITDRS